MTKIVYKNPVGIQIFERFRSEETSQNNNKLK